MRYDATRAVVMRCEIGGTTIYSSPFVVRRDGRTKPSKAPSARQKVLCEEAANMAEAQLRNLFDRHLADKPESGVLLTGMAFDGFVDVYVPKER